MKILISAAETSSDLHGAELLKAIRNEISPSTQLEAFGIGGPKLQQYDFETIVDARQLLAMGFTEILRSLPRIFRALNEVTQAALEKKPDIAIVIDYPDFHFRLAKRLKKLGIPVVYFIPPKVWAWRRKRIHFLRKYFVRILCILPFEEEFYKGFDIPVTYVGNPLVDELPLELSKGAARKELGLGDTEKVLVLMPGSRMSELKEHLELMLESAALATSRLRASGILKQDQRLQVLLPFAVTSQLEPLRTRVNSYLPKLDALLDIKISQGNAHQCLLAADAGLIKSGTSTLEAGLLKCPHAVVYRPSQITAWIFKYLIRYQGPIGLVNLVAGSKHRQSYLVPEILCENVTSEALAQQIMSLMMDTDKQTEMMEGFAMLRKRVCGHMERGSPSVCAAREVIEIVQNLRNRE